MIHKSLFLGLVLSLPVLAYSPSMLRVQDENHLLYGKTILQWDAKSGRYAYRVDLPPIPRPVHGQLQEEFWDGSLVYRQVQEGNGQHQLWIGEKIAPGDRPAFWFWEKPIPLESNERILGASGRRVVLQKKTRLEERLPHWPKGWFFTQMEYLLWDLVSGKKDVISQHRCLPGKTIYAVVTVLNEDMYFLDGSGTLKCIRRYESSIKTLKDDVLEGLGIPVFKKVRDLNEERQLVYSFPTAPSQSPGGEILLPISIYQSYPADRTRVEEDYQKLPKQIQEESVAKGLWPLRDDQLVAFGERDLFLGYDPIENKCRILEEDEVGAMFEAHQESKLPVLKQASQYYGCSADGKIKPIQDLLPTSSLSVPFKKKDEAAKSPKK